VRRRLRITYVSLLAAVLLGLDIPLAFALTIRATQEMFIDRFSDTERFASQAEPALRTGLDDLLMAEIRQYDDLFGVAVVVVRRDGSPALVSRDGLDLTSPAVRPYLDAALTGRLTGLQQVVWPWRDDALVVALPVGRGGEVIGAVLTVSPTFTLRTATGWKLAALAGLSGVVLLVGTAAAGPLARWMLRPVYRLDAAADALSEGRFDDRVPVESGPPELRRLGASFNRMAERITTLIERQRRFASYASHQLRTPLATMRLCVENLDTVVRPNGLEYYRILEEEITRLGEMCDSLLIYARADATAGEGDGADAVALVERRIAAWQMVAEHADVRLVRSGSDGATVRAARALDHALDALLSNAVKFAGPGAEVVVTVEQADAGWVDVHVVDNGPGMSADDLARATEPFWRGGGAQNIDGSGLGVTIIEALVTASGGSFELRAAQPHGVHAWIRLPAASAATGADG
jgi:signal transduction histidine kinase